VNTRVLCEGGLGMLGGEKSAMLLKFWWFHIVSRYHPRVSLPRPAPKMGRRLSLVCPGSEPQGQMLLPNSHARFVRLLIYDERVIRTTVGNCYPSLPRTFCGSGGLSSFFHSNSGDAGSLAVVTSQNFRVLGCGDTDRATTLRLDLEWPLPRSGDLKVHFVV